MIKREWLPDDRKSSLVFMASAALVLAGGVTLSTIWAQPDATLVDTTQADAILTSSVLTSSVLTSSVLTSSVLSESITIHGVVLGPEGQPVAGAELHVNVNEYQDSLKIGESRSDGTFRLQVPRETLSRSVGAGVALGRCKASLLAVADGVGAAWQLLPSQNGGRFGEMQSEYNVSLQMVDDLPVNGRVVDQSGQPVEGAIVSADVIHELRGSNWHKMSSALETLDVDTMTRKEIDVSRWFSYQYPRAYGIIQAVTDDSGRYTLTGLGSNRAVRLRVSGPGVKSPPAFSVLVRSDASEFANRVRDKYPPKGKSHGVRLFGVNPTIEVQRTRTIAGTIRDATTGQPIEGAEVYVLGGTRQRTARLNRVWTDRQGRYRLVRNDKQAEFTVVADGDEHLYLPASRTFKNELNALETIADIQLSHGVLVRGKVVEANSNLPIASEHRDFCEDQQPGPLLAGCAKYFPLEGNEWLNDLGEGLVSIPFEYCQTNHRRWVYIDEKGEFQIAVPPGKGVVLIDATPPRGEPRFWRTPEVPYLTIVGNVTGTTPMLQSTPSKLSFPGMQKTIGADDFHAYQLIHVDANDDPINLRFEVKLALSQAIRFVDPDGNQITDGKVAGLFPMHDRAFVLPINWKDSDDLAYFDEPIGKNRRIVAMTGDGKYGVSEAIQSIDKSARTIKMHRTASFRFRVVDQATGTPLAGYQFGLRYGSGVAPTYGFSFDSKELFVADKDGAVTVRSVIPGEPFSLNVAKTLKLTDGRSKRAAMIKVPQELEHLTLQPNEFRNLNTLEAEKIDERK